MKRYLALILVILTMLCIGSFALAEADNTRASDYFDSYGISLLKVGSARLNITFSCAAVGIASQIGVSNYYIQCYDEDAARWYTVSGPHDGSYSYNAAGHSFAKTFQGVNGETYRVKCTFLCVKDGTAESKSYTSRTVKMP